jgi:formylglycine-generating enzyme required for sulfatase activity
MADVFISYVEEDGQAAEELARGMEAAGHSAWYYERDSIPGPPYLVQVSDAIERASAVVLLISRDSLSSNQVTIEVVRAHESGKPFVPVLIGITHAEFQQRQPTWRIALGASTSIRVPPQGAAAIVSRVVQGLRALGLQPGSVAAAPPPCETPQPAATARPAAPPPKRAAATPSGTPDLITNSIGMKLKLIPAGKFLMGSEKGEEDEKPVHKVTITKPFYTGICLVTQAEYERVMKANPSHFKGPNRPVETVSWNDAVEFCRRLSEMERRAYRLSTEAEWEYACRAGSTTEYCFGDDQAKLSEYAWYLGNSGLETHDVGQRKPNAWGLHDMHGNVWEWCEDVWHPNYGSAPSDGSAWLEGGNQRYRVLRGGSRSLPAAFCRSAARVRSDPTRVSCVYGCRVVLRDS